MKKAGKKYNFRSKQDLKSEASCRAADRAESYTYRRSYGSPVLSVEALTNMQDKLNTFSNSSSKIWEDRGSRIAIPYGSELYLNNERGIESVILGGTRNYFDDLSNPEHEPDARPKFPYDQEAHTGANKIKRLFRRNIDKRNNAARIIQRNTKSYMMKLALIEQIRYTNELISKVQKKFRRSKKRLQDMRRIREKEAAARADALKIQNHALLMKQLAEDKENKLKRGMVLLTREARAFIHRRRRARGRARRMNNAAKRIQGWFRFCRFRRRLKKICDARIYIIYRWRRFFRRKYRPQALVLQRMYRQQQVKLKIRFLQRMMKGALGRRRFLRKRLEVLAIERSRNSRECVAVTRKLRNMSSSLAWVEDDQQVPPTAIADHMRRLDVYSLGVLQGNALQYDKDFDCLHPAEYECADAELLARGRRAVPRLRSTEADSLSQRIVIAILNIFVNRPGECLDHTALTVCRAYLKPSTQGKARDRLPLEAWKNLVKYPMVNVESLSKVLEPTSVILKKVKVSGRDKYLPAEVLAKAVLVYRWTMHYEWATKQAVDGFRVQHKPRRVCPKCQYPMTFDGDVIDHRVCFNNGSYMAWMSKDLDSCRETLYNYCCNPKTFVVPDMKRDLDGDRVKLSNSDLAATTLKYQTRTVSVKNVDTATHDNVDVKDAKKKTSQPKKQGSGGKEKAKDGKKKPKK